jgi:hypothetical protein
MFRQTATLNAAAKVEGMRHAAQTRDIGREFLRQGKGFFLVVSGQEPDNNFRHDFPRRKSLKNKLK